MADLGTTVTRVTRTGSLLRVELTDLAAPVDDALAVAVVRLVSADAELLGLDVEPTAAGATGADEGGDRDEPGPADGSAGPISRVLAACADHLRAEGVSRVVATAELGHPDRVEPLLAWGFRPAGGDAHHVHLVLDL